MKERLLGAAVLIIAAVILIPTLLDGPKDARRESQALQLPVPDSEQRVNGDNIRTHTVNLNDKPDSQRAPDLPREVDNARQVSTETRPDPAPPPPVPAIVRDKEPDSAVAPLAQQKGSWAVQVGSFSSESNARRLIEHLRESDYPAFLVRNVVSGRVMFRVRVGPEADRERAEALAERLRSDRQQTQIVSHP